MLKMRDKVFTRNCILENYMSIEKIIKTLKYFVVMSDFQALHIFFIFNRKCFINIWRESVCENLSQSLYWKNWKTISNTFSSLIDTMLKDFHKFLVVVMIQNANKISMYTRAWKQVDTFSKFCEIHIWNRIFAWKASVNQKHC